MLRAPAGTSGCWQGACGEVRGFGSHSSLWSSSGCGQRCPVVVLTAVPVGLCQARARPRSPQQQAQAFVSVNSWGFPFSVILDLLLVSGWSKPPRRNQFTRGEALGAGPGPNAQPQAAPDLRAACLMLVGGVWLRLSPLSCGAGLHPTRYCVPAASSPRWFWFQPCWLMRFWALAPPG